MLGSGEIALLCVLALQWTVFAPFMSVCWYRTWKLRENFFLRKRFTCLLLAERGLVTLDMVLVVSSRFIAVLVDNADKSDEYILSLFRVIYIYAMWVGIARVWLCYYDLKLRKASSKEEWSALITQNQELVKSDFISPDIGSSHSSDIFSSETATEMEFSDNDLENEEEDDFDVSSGDGAGGISSSSTDSGIVPKKSENWFINNLDSWGNCKRVVSWAMAIATVFAVLDIGLIMASFVKGSGITCRMTSNINLAIVLVSNLIPLVIFFLIPRVSDFIYLRDEIKYLAIIKSICVVLFGAIDAIAPMYLGKRGLIVTVVLIGDVASMVDTYVSFVWVIQKLKQDGLLNAQNGSDLLKKQSSLDLYGPPMPRALSSSRISQSSRSSVIMPGHNRAQVLSTLMSDDEGFQIWMQHLMNEFSEECLVSVIEFVQFKQHIASILTGSDNCVACMELDCKLDSSQCECPSVMRPLRFNQMIFPDCVPKSGIVFGKCFRSCRVSSFDQHACNLARLLFAKFLATRARLQINVSFQTTLSVKADLDQLMQPFVDDSERVGKSPHTMLSDRLHRVFHLFDQSINEMQKLMMHSLSRFILTPQFDQWMKTRRLAESELNSSMISIT